MAGFLLEHLVRSGIRADVVNNFDLGNTHGLTAVPEITQHKNYDTTEPFIHIRSESSIEIDNTKEVDSREYATVLECVTSFDAELGGPHITDLMANEAVRIATTTLPTISGGTAYIQTVDSTADNSFIRDSRVYYQKNITILTRVTTPVAGSSSGGTTPTNVPVQAPIYLFRGFDFVPTMNRIELHDTGTIDPATTYSSSNNGYDFTTATYTLSAGSDGVVGSDGTVAVGATDEISIVSNLNYELASDNTTTETLTATTVFPRIKSVRFGTITGSTIGDVTNLTPFRTNGNTIDYGTVAPVGEVLSITVDAGERAYIIYDDNEADLVQIVQAGFNNNIISDFTMTTSNGYKIYILDNPFVFANTLQITLS